MFEPNLKLLEGQYHNYCRENSNIAAHLPRLRRLAGECSVVREFGVQFGRSSTALILGVQDGLRAGLFGQGVVQSYDVHLTPQAATLRTAAGNLWELTIQSSLEAPAAPCDMLFIDSLHQYGQLKGELDRHADSAHRILAFHDVVTFGSVNAKDNHGDLAWRYERGAVCPPEHYGLRKAIDELMIRDPSWRIAESHWDCHGLLVLRRSICE